MGATSRSSASDVAYRRLHRDIGKSHFVDALEQLPMDRG
jgi:hypothetical protein